MTVNWNDPSAVGVPSSAPAAVRLTPVGRLPEASDHVAVVSVPVNGFVDTMRCALSCSVYGWPIVPPFTDWLVMPRPASMLKANCFCDTLSPPHHGNPPWLGRRSWMWM